MKISLIPQVGNETVHCSQGDTNRQWQFDIYGDKKIDIVDSPNPTYWIEKGGTEEILPTNTSVPSTSPIKCDIQYTDGLRTDQEFTYRESPATEDGSAKLKSIYGNTIVWNQQCGEDMTFHRGTSVWNNTFTENGVTFTYNNEHSVTVTGTPTGRAYIYMSPLGDGRNGSFVAKPNHIFYLKYSGLPNGADLFSSEYDGSTWLGAGVSKNNTYHTVRSNATDWTGIGIDIPASLTGTALNFTLNISCFDLTQMFGSGNEPTAQEFDALFPLYYNYDSGSLLSFNGNGIQTTGKNLLPKATSSNTMNGITWTLNDDGTIHAEGTSTGRSYIRITIFNVTRFMLPKGNYVYTLSPSGDGISNITSLIGSYKYGSTSYYKNVVICGNSNNFIAGFSITDEFVDCVFDIAVEVQTSGKTLNCDLKPMIRSASVSDDSYEPYTTSITNLPISTYFPNGMKSVPKAYDELTSSKATTRVGRILMQNLTWSMISSGVFGASLSNVPPSWTRSGIGVLLLPLYTEESWDSVDTGTYTDKSIHGLVYNNMLVLRVYDSSCTTLEQFTTKITDVPLLYELATPTETNITSATMVTEYGESDLDSNGVVICNEGMSKYSGFHDAKIKVSDGDGDVYSAKFQVHVERKPR